jgi:hypothetical protein
MNRLSLFFALALVVVLPALAAGRDEPGRRGDELDRLARRLERQAHEVRNELLTPFRVATQHRLLEERMQEIERQATRIHQMTERGERSRQVRELLEKIDDEFRTVDRAIEELGRERELDRRAYNRVRDDLRDMRETMHRMRREL